LARIAALGLLAVSVALLTGIAGLPTLGQTAPFAVGAYTVGLLARADIGVGVVYLLVAALLAGAFSAVVGIFLVHTRGVTFLMVTVAVGELVAITAGQWRDLTGGTDGLIGIPAIVPLWGIGPMIEPRAVYLYTVTVVLAITAGLILLLRSPVGLLLRCCRDNEVRMRASGHTVTGYLLTAYIVAGAIAGVAGGLLVTITRYISPSDVGFATAALVLLAVIIGGVTSIPGALLGTLVVFQIRDSLAAPLPGHAPLLLGVAFVAVVYLLPGGLAGLADMLRRRLYAETQP
jgi:branched-chain amino acid transport system permease protein